VFEYFSDAQAVNQALRTLIALVPEKRRVETMAVGSVKGEGKPSAKISP
jgi:hypothetical protein